MGRTLWISSLAFAAGVGVGALLRGCDPAVPAPSRAGAASATTTSETARESPGRARAATQAVESSRDAETSPPPAPAMSDAVAPDVREIPVAGVATGFHEIEVDVVDAEGSPTDDAVVYGLPAGAPGTFDDDFVALARDSEGGRFRLRLPSPGSFDVCARTDSLLARAEDVAVPGATTLRIALPRAPVAVFVLDPESPPPGDVTFAVSAVLAHDARWCPGRYESLSVSSSSGHTVGPDRARLELSLGPIEFEVAEYVAVPLPGGGHQYRAPERPAVFEPRRFVPPATVRVRAPDPVARPLRVALTLASPGYPVHAHRTVPLRLEFGGEVVEKETWLSWEGRGAGKVEFLHSVRAPTGLLRWSGPVVVPGAARWDLDRSPQLEATVDLIPPTPADGVAVLVDLPVEAAAEDGFVVVHFPAPDDPERTTRALVPVGKEVVLQDPGDWLLVVVEDPDGNPMQRRVAGPVRARRGGRAVLKPRPGGYVVFAPRDAPPEGAGAIVVASSDGAPFFHEWQGSGGSGEVAELGAGAILGPFEPGVVSLDVRVGGALWGRYEVTVRENAWTTFAPRPFR